MTNIVKTTVTTTTVTTETTVNSPVIYMPINEKLEPGIEEFYKKNNIPVRTMNKFGKNRAYALVPIEGYNEASDEDKVILAAKADEFTQAIDNKRRTDSRANAKVDMHENVSLEGLYESGYNPSDDTNNPEYVVAKKLLYKKLHAIIDELTGEDLAIVNAIMEGVSERALSRELGISNTTLQRHRAKLMDKLRELLGADWLN